MQKVIIGTPHYTGEKIKIRVKINKIISNKDVGENMISTEADIKVCVEPRNNESYKNNENTKTKKTVL